MAPNPQLVSRADADADADTTNCPLAGKTCLVTGGSRGIGRGISEAFADAGADVVVNYRSSADEAESVVEAIEDDDCCALATQADVSRREEVEAMYDHVSDELGAIDVLVNNAGITRDGTFAEMDADQWQQVIEVNLNGAFNTTKAFYDDLVEADQGRLINISSVVGKQGNYGQANYAAAKSGLFGMTRSLALELASNGTTANCIAPGYTRTEMVESVREDIQDQIRDQIPQGRFATVDEIAAVARFLASDDAQYITGEVLDVNGGLDL